MRYLVLGLFPEGPTDSRFLPDIIYREALELVLHRAVEPVEIQESVSIFESRPNNSRADAICRAAAEVDIFVVHADATPRTRAQLFTGIVRNIQELACDRCGIEPDRIIALFPTRETEAWALCDPDAIARACGFVAWPTTASPEWNPANPEALSDPKATLDRAIASLLGGRRRPRPYRSAPYVDRIGRETDLSRLRRLASFNDFSQALAGALVSRGVIR